MPRSWFQYEEHSDLLLSSSWLECEGRIRAFEDAWQRGSTPSIDEFLARDVANRPALLIELVQVDLEFRLKAGENSRVERYLTAYPELAENRAAVLDLIAAEHELRSRQAACDLSEFTARFPEFASDLVDRLRDDLADTVLTSAQARATGRSSWPAVTGYEIVAELGRGGMGVVYKASEPKLGRFVAIKFLPDEFAHDAERLGRLLDEARTASALNHPHICTIHALAEHEGRPYFVMEFIEGDTLRTLAKRRPSVDKVARWIRQAARALAAAHAAGVVHRDIKPDNIMVRGDGYIKVLDFGLARRLPADAPHDPDAAARDKSGLAGTVAYMSPEQARGEVVGPESDIFSLGIVFYQLVTGEHPFVAVSAAQTLEAIQMRRPAPAARFNHDVSAALESLIDSMLRHDPRLRPTAAELDVALSTTGATDAKDFPQNAPRAAILRRQPELRALRAAFDDARAGRGRMIGVTGEPGIGKTTLVGDFLATLALSNDSSAARGQCSESLAGAEAYGPIVDAIEDPLRADVTGRCGRILKAVAPTWHSRVAAARSGSAPNLDAGSPLATSQHAMAREFGNLLEEIARLGPVVLFLDDVHWADASTVDLLAHLGGRCATLRVLVIVTYRPTELLLGPHPFHRVKLELQSRSVFTELPLDFLTRDDIGGLLALAYPDHAFPESFAAFLHGHTDGNPMFAVEALRDLRERGVLAEVDGRWQLIGELPDLSNELPGSIRGMIQGKLERLDNGDRRLLAAASVQGTEFDSAVVAGARLRCHGCRGQVADLGTSSRAGSARGEIELPDRTLSLRYAFVHGLYRHVLFHDLTPSRRASLGASLAKALQRRYGPKQSEAAASLAYLFEVARDYAQAARHCWQAAQNAARIFAHREAITLSQRGLRLLALLPADAERDALELSLQTTLGPQLQVTQGFAAPEAEVAFRRALELCQKAGDSAPQFAVVWGLWLISKVRSELKRAEAMANELFALARARQDPDLALQAHQALGMTAFCRGNPTSAIEHVEHAAVIYHPQHHETHSYLFGQDPGVICTSFGAVSLWLLGFPDQAKRRSAAAIEASRRLSPATQALAFHFAAMLHQLCREDARVLEFANATRAIATEHGLSFWLAGSNILGGWAEAMIGNVDAGEDRLRRGLRDWEATGSVTYQTFHYALFADVLLLKGQRDEASEILNDALELAERTGEKFVVADIDRRLGAIAEAANDVDGADRHYRRAFDTATKQDARSMLLRSAMMLDRLHRNTGRAADSRKLLRETFARFNEGFDTADLCEAAVLLHQA